MPTTKLREGGCYALPDRREFIARLSGRGEYSLYTPRAWNGFGFAEYRVNSEGRILSKGISTRWRVADLKDTGRTIDMPLVVANPFS